MKRKTKARNDPSNSAWKLTLLQPEKLVAWAKLSRQLIKMNPKSLQKPGRQVLWPGSHPCSVILTPRALSLRTKLKVPQLGLRCFNLFEILVQIFCKLPFSCYLLHKFILWSHMLAQQSLSLPQKGAAFNPWKEREVLLSEMLCVYDMEFLPQFPACPLTLWESFPGSPVGYVHPLPNSATSKPSPGLIKFKVTWAIPPARTEKLPHFFWSPFPS